MSSHGAEWLNHYNQYEFSVKEMILWFLQGICAKKTSVELDL